MRKITFSEATREAMAEEMEKYPEVFVMGEDLARQGGIFGQFKGLPDEFPGSMPGQIKPRTDPGNHKQQHHEPGIYDVLEYIIILHIQLCDPARNTRDAFRIVHVKYVIYDHDHYHSPFDVV